MQDWASSFIITFICSFFQAGILFLTGLIFETLYYNKQGKRFPYFLLLITQVFVSVLTFFYSYLDISTTAPHPIIFTSNFLKINGVDSWLFVGYLLIFLWKAYQTSRNYHLLNQEVQRKKVESPTLLLNLLDKNKHLLSLKKKIRIICITGNGSPFLLGFFKPVLIFPVALLNQLTLDETETLLRHELFHLKRLDSLKNLSLLLLDHIFWFNPFIRKMIEKIRLNQEIGCDQSVLNVGSSQLTYFNALYKAAATSESSGLKLAAVDQKEQLLFRMRWMADKKSTDSKKKIQFPIILFFVSSIILSTPVFRKSEIQNNSMHTTFSSIPIIPKIVRKELPNEVHPSTKNKMAKIQLPIKELARLKNNRRIQSPISDQSFTNKKPDEATDSSYQWINCKQLPGKNKYLLIKDETPQGKVLIRAYSVHEEAGKWVRKLEWMMVESNNRSSSDTQ